MKSLKLKFISYILPVVVIISLTFLAFFVYRSNVLLEQELTEFGFSSAESLSYSCELGVHSEDATFLVAPVQGIFEEEDVVSVAVYNREGRIIISREKEELEEEIPRDVVEDISIKKSALMRSDYTRRGKKIYNFFSPIFASGALIPIVKKEPKEIIGFTKVGMSLEIIEEQTKTMFYIGLVMVLLMILVGGSIVIFLVGKMTTPIVNLTNGAEKIGKGDLNYRIKVKTGDEIETLANSFNVMTKNLQKTMGELEDERANLEIKVKERTRELKESQEQLIQSAKMATIGTLAGGIAHEINNPMGAILTNTQMLLRDIKDPDQRESLKLIEEGSRRCRDIVQALLKYSRKPEFDEFRLINLNEVINDTCNLLQHQLDKDNVKIKKEYGEITNINGNANELQQVFTNLILNSMDAIKRIKDFGNIIIKTYQEDKFIVVEVIDNGCGISKENLDKIFDPFFTTKDVGEGVGLGLSISYKIIEKYNGNIGVKSKVGKGTTFTIKLPIERK